MTHKNLITGLALAGVILAVSGYVASCAEPWNSAMAGWVPVNTTNTAAPTAPTKSTSFVNGISVSPYATIAFENFDGRERTGAGVDVGLNLSKTIQFVTFGESDNTADSTIDRVGGGLQITGQLGKWLRPFARFSVGYSFDKGVLEKDVVFLRPQFGANIDIWQHKSWHASLAGSWALDVDTKGNSAQRLFGGLVLGTSF